MNTYTVKHVAGEDVITAGSVHYGDWVKFYRESTPNRDLVPVYAVGANSVIAISQADAIVSSSTGQSEVEVPVLMCRTKLFTESTTQYTAPADGTALVKNIVVSNGSLSKPATVEITLGGIRLLPSVPVPVSTMISFDLEQVMVSGEVLAALTTSADPRTVTLHVSGTETRRAGAGATASDDVAQFADMVQRLQEEFDWRGLGRPKGSASNIPVSDSIEDTTESGHYSPEKEKLRAEKRAAQLESILRDVQHRAANWKHAGLSPEGVAMADTILGMELDTP